MDFIVRHKIILLVLVLAVAGFFWYGSSKPPQGSLLVTEEAGAANGPGNKDLVETLLTLRAVSLSGTILHDPLFGSLKDFSTQVMPEAVGRTDPFSPLSATAVPPTSTSTKANQLFKAGRP